MSEGGRELAGHSKGRRRTYGRKEGGKDARRKKRRWTDGRKKRKSKKLECVEREKKTFKVWLVGSKTEIERCKNRREKFIC